MTMKQKIGKGLIAAGLLGCLSGGYDRLENNPHPQIEKSEAVDRMYDLEEEFRLIRYRKIDITDPKIANHYLGLAGEYQTLLSKPLVLESRKNYEDSWKRFNNRTNYETIEILGSMLLGLIGTTMRQNKNKKP